MATLLQLGWRQVRRLELVRLRVLELVRLLVRLRVRVRHARRNLRRKHAVGLAPLLLFLLVHDADVPRHARLDCKALVADRARVLLFACAVPG